jgi:uncharacterized membrane protein
VPPNPTEDRWLIVQLVALTLFAVACTAGLIALFLLWE